MLDSMKNLCSVQVSGHAGFMQEQGDPVCASVTLLVRTIGRYLQQQGLLVGVEINEGLLQLDVIASSDERIGVACGILRLGLNDLMTEWPSHVKLIVKEKRR